MNRISRRQFLNRGAAITASACLFEQSRILRAVPAAETELGKVKIRDVQTATIMMRYPAHLVKVTTDSGLFGVVTILAPFSTRGPSGPERWR